LFNIQRYPDSHLLSTCPWLIFLADQVNAFQVNALTRKEEQKPHLFTPFVESSTVNFCKTSSNVLHQHLDNVSSQAARIRQAADFLVGMPGEGELADSTESGFLNSCRDQLSTQREGNCGYATRALQAGECPA